ncbi:MAG: hypothetical protein M1829_002021 [Trizodia sp. TS-e1964]|nr:MAG: hypothetical protein M1829_002021 [Trizodia sp. TS-e1964]
MILLPTILILTLSLLTLRATATPTLNTHSIQPRNPNPINIAIIRKGLVAARKSIAELYNPIPPKAIFWLLASFPGADPLPRAGFLLHGVDISDLDSPTFVPDVEHHALLWRQSADDARMNLLRLRVAPTSYTDYLLGPLLGPLRIEGFLRDLESFVLLMHQQGVPRGDLESVRDVFMEKVRGLGDFRELVSSARPAEWGKGFSADWI